MSWLSTFLRKLFTIREQQESDVVKPFLDHLEDLRMTLFKMAACLLVGMVIAYFFHKDLTHLVRHPLDEAGLTLISQGITEAFTISIKLSFYAGIVLSFPFLLYFAAEFILPALTRRERRLLIPGILIGFLLFSCGVVISYRFILPKTLIWFNNYTKEMRIELLPRAGEYFGFVTHLTLACGLLCELPIVVIALSLLGLISYKLMASTRAYAVILFGILVAILAPAPDPITFLTLFIPVMGIYELCIWIVWFIERQKARSLPIS